jgi:hypothetical protein
VLEALYPKDSRFKVEGLVANQELNGKMGVCNGIYRNVRVGVYIAELKKEYAIKPKNLHKV